MIALIDLLIPKAENPHEIELIEHMNEAQQKEKKDRRLMRMGTFSALAIAIHNFPEGLATFTAAMNDPNLGIAVSVPVYYATGSKKKAFTLSFLSGLAEPVGAIVGYLILMQFMNPSIFGILFAGVAGIMVFISIDELLPTAREYGEHHLSVYGMIAGMGVMALSLLMFI